MSGPTRQASGVADELQRISADVDGALRSFVDRQPVSDFYDLTRYHFGWQAGSAPPFRPRSVLCILACQACGGSSEAAWPLAVAVALLHEFSVNQRALELHQATSRGRPSVWNVWGTAQAMNAGDGMHALAKVALLEARATLPAGSILHLQAELDECCLRICDAVQQELTAGEAASPELAACKSAVLFELAAYGGCYIAGAGSAASARLRRLGELLGSAAAVQPLDAGRALALQREALALAGELPAQVRPQVRALAEELLSAGADLPAGSY